MAERWVSSTSLVFLTVSLSMVVDAAVPAVFIFGDSTADVGTNSHFSNLTVAKANFLHNGIDYPGSIPTGRFSNGYNSADFLSELMGFRRSPPPFLDLLDEKRGLSKDVKYGANFASGGSGLIRITGTLLGKNINLGEQIKQFATVHQNLTALLGQDATDNLLAKSLFFISIGSNDIFQFFLFNKTSYKQEFIKTSDKQKFITYLIRAYEDHLTKLYSLGARKFGIISVPPIGCCPVQRNNDTGECEEELNEYARMFYSTVKALLQKLSYDLKEMKYSLGNTYEMVTHFINNPHKFNFKELKSACCGKLKFNGGGPCIPKSDLCSNRDEYLFWDWFHPTEAASKLAARTLYDGEPRFVTPINLKELAEDDS